jgi:hypothetical protein
MWDASLSSNLRARVIFMVWEHMHRDEARADLHCTSWHGFGAEPHAIVVRMWCDAIAALQQSLQSSIGTALAISVLGV